MRLLVAVMTCHKLDYFIDADTKDWLDGKRCMSQSRRVMTQRATWIKRLPQGVDYKFFYGTRLRPSLDTRRDTIQPTVDREPLSDEVYLSCGDNYTSNPDKMKAICRYALANGYDFLLRVDDDTFIYPDRLLREDWQHDYAGANKGSFHPGGCLFLSRRAMELIVRSRPISYADDLWIGQVMAENRIPMHGIASIHNEFGTGYNVNPASLPIHRLSSLHSCQPEAMKYLDEHAED